MHPEGSKLPAFERNILKLRVFEMMLFLFHAEDFKQTIIDAIQTTDKFCKLNRGAAYVERIPPGGKRPFETALRIMVTDGVFTDAEEEEIVRLIDYRNTVAHRINSLTGDLSASRVFAWPNRRKGVENYDYTALKRLKSLKAKFDDGYFDYICTTRCDLSFDPIEKALGSEIKALRKKIDRQYLGRKERDQALKRELEIKLHEKEAANDFYHPANQYGEGRLTPRGVEVCYRLFDGGRTPLAVAYLMRLSLKATRRRQKLWINAGGAGRTKAVFPRF